MKVRYGSFRKEICLLAALALSAALAACGGGGSGSVTTGGSGTGSAAVGISVASAPDFPAGTVFGASTASPVPSVPPVQPVFDNVFVTVTKIALLPTSGPEGPDPGGETEKPNDSAENGQGGMRGFLTVVLPHPVVIDLLHPPTGRQIARGLNTFPEVPAGEYSKIRVYYESVAGVRSGFPDTPFHPTANYHFDVHFVGGNLVVPESTDPQGGIRFFSISINIVGLQYHQAGSSANVLLRPQIFATVGAPKYLVHGVADRVDRLAGSFDILTPGGRTVSAAFGGGTAWAFVDQWVATKFLFPGAHALRDTAIVDVIGSFLGGVLQADEVDITFPDAVEGSVNGTWTDNAFVVRTAADNVTVFPMPDRYSAYYDDNTAVTHDPLSQSAIDNNVAVRARGYAAPEGIEAFWISIGL